MNTATGLQHRSPRLGVLLGMVLLLAAVGALWWALADGRDQGTASSSGSDEVVLAQSDEGDAEPDEPEVASVELDVTYEVFLARDPFESIRPPEPAATDPDDANGDGNGNGTGDSSDGSTDPDDPTDPSAPDSKDPVDGNGNGPCRTGTEAVCDGTVVVLQSVTATSATIQVGGVSYAVAPGDVFAGNFQLLRIDGDCVDILYLDGDEADVFELCDGDIVAK